MFYQEFLSRNQEIQNKLLLFLDKEDNIEVNYQNLIDLLINHKIIENVHELKSFLYLIANVSNNHHQIPGFNSKIGQLFQYLKEDIKKNFTNLKIFDIFKKSKSILLILIELKIMAIDQSVLNRMESKEYFNRQYHHFFYPEIHPLISEELISTNNGDINSTEKNDEDNSNSTDDDEDNEYSRDEYDDEDNENSSNEKESFYKSEIYKNFVKMYSKKLPNNFFEKRKIGQNEDYICKLIREDLIDEFITYINQHDYSLNSFIQQSIFETNSFLIEKKPTLIEYSAFFGSIQIFKYLYLNNVKLTPSLWIYAIHGDNQEIISILIEKNIKPNDKTYEIVMKEAIKCHHNDAANYIQNNFQIQESGLQNFQNRFKNNIYSYCFHYYNYLYFPDELNDRFFFYYACKYDYYTIVEFFLKNKSVDLNEKIIFYILFYEVYFCIYLKFQQYNMQVKKIILK